VGYAGGALVLPGVGFLAARGEAPTAKLADTCVGNMR
jgi:hypothetical protein